MNARLGRVLATAGLVLTGALALSTPAAHATTPYGSPGVPIVQQQADTAVSIPSGNDLGQSFTESGTFNSVAARMDTYGTTSAGITLSLYSGGVGGTLVAQQSFTSVTDGSYVTLNLSAPLPGAGSYYLDASSPVGTIGWWTSTPDVYPGGTTYGDGTPSQGDREFMVGVAGNQVTQTGSTAATQLTSGNTLGQTFTENGTFNWVQAQLDTYGTTTSGLTLSLYSGGAGGTLVGQTQLSNVSDGSWAQLAVPAPLPGAGTYYLQASSPVGTIGWWSSSTDVYSGGTAYTNGSASSGDRTFKVIPAGQPINQLSYDTDVSIPTGNNLGQSFTESGPFASVSALFETSGSGAGITLSLYAGGAPGGTLITSQTFTNVADYQWLTLTLSSPLPGAGSYYLQADTPLGTIGWPTTTPDVYPGGNTYGDGVASGGDRAFAVTVPAAAPATFTNGSAGVDGGYTVTSNGVVLSRTDGSNFSYNYAPSVIVSGSTVKMWWCGHGPNGGDNIYYSTRALTGSAWATPQLVLQPTGSGWESTFVCDPSVLTGSWTIAGSTYAYAMYYDGAGSTPAGTAIGVAFSTDGVNWVRYSGNPIIQEPNAGYDYGVGMPAVFSNGGSAVSMMYYDSEDHHSTEFATSTDGTTFTVQYKLPFAGLDDPADLAYSSSESRWYLLTKDQGAESDQATYIFKSTSSTLSSSDWVYVGSVGQDTTGYWKNHNAGWYRNADGTLYEDASNNKFLVFGAQEAIQGISEPNTWELGQATLAGTNFASITAPGSFDLSGPTSGASFNAANLSQFSWTASTNATSYEVTIATSSTMTPSSVVYTSTVHPTEYDGLETYLPATVTPLTPGTTYYWTVKAVNAAGTTLATTGPWSFSTASTYDFSFSSGSPAPWFADTPATLFSGGTVPQIIQFGSNEGGLRLGAEFEPARVALGALGHISITLKNPGTSTSMTVAYKLMSDSPNAAWRTTTAPISSGDTSFHTYTITMSSMTGWGTSGDQLAFLEFSFPQAGTISVSDVDLY